jgi:hypothetical protein
MTQLESSDVATGPGVVVSADERAELERLRREVEALRADKRPARAKFRWRSMFAVVLIVLGCVLAPVAGVAVWTNNQVSDTDRFVRSVGPLVDDPDVQSALTNRLTATVFQYVDVQSLADDAVTALAAQGLPTQLVDRLNGLTPTLTSAVTGFVRDKIAEVVASPAFASAWNQAIRSVHRTADAVLSGSSESIVVRGDAVLLDLAPFIDQVKDRLSDAGLTAVDLVPEVHPTVELAKADTLVRAQTAYSTMNTVAGVLPWMVLIFFAVGVYLARNRFRALVGVGLGLGLAMVVLAAGLLVARSLLVDAVPAAAAPATASGFDIVVTYLRLGLRALLVLGLVLALAGFLAGRSETAVHIRRATAGRLHAIRGERSAGGPVATWVRRHIKGLRIGAVALALLTFVFLTQPSGAAILVIASVLLVVLAVIEFLAGPGAPPPSDTVPSVRTEPPAGTPSQAVTTSTAGAEPRPGTVPSPATPPPTEATAPTAGVTQT